MTLTVPTLETNSPPQGPPQLFRHSKRREWGMGALISEGEGRRAYQFEDGTIRKIKKGFYGLLEPVEEFPGVEDVYERLMEFHQSGNQEATETSVSAVCSFDAQVELFLQLYPKGFADPAWIAEHRGDPETGSAKREREPSLRATRELLSADRCAEMMEQGQQADLVEAAADVLAKTSLVPIAHARLVRGMTGEDAENYAESVAHLAALDEGREFDIPYRRHMRILKKLHGRRPAWRTATALVALLHPQHHVCVRRSAFQRQAGSIAPKARYTARPRVRSYRSYLGMAQDVRRELADRGQEPRDLLDVHDFIWTTLRKSALEHLGVNG